MTAEPLLEVEIDLRRSKPWFFAEPETLWHISAGQFSQMRITDSIACADGEGHFKLLTWGFCPGWDITAGDIFAARELIPVLATDPLTALYVRDQPVMDEALTRREESR
jgi:hypothetical protein